MMSRPSFAPAVALVAPLAFCLLGCGTPLDMNAVTQTVSAGISSQMTLPIASVACPTTSRSAKQGDVFECVATPQIGGKLTVKVTQTDAKGTVSWAVVKTEGLVDLKMIEAAIQERVKKQAHVDATASCGGYFRIAKVGESFDCSAKTANKGEATMVVTVLDDTGRVTIGFKQ